MNLREPTDQTELSRWQELEGRLHERDKERERLAECEERFVEPSQAWVRFGLQMRSHGDGQTSHVV